MKTYKEIAAEGAAKGDSLLDILHQLQEQYGYISPEALEQTAEALDMTPAEVFEAASFYSYLSLEPVGRHIIRVCRSAPCHIAGMEAVVAKLEQLLGISMGETTKDGRFSLQYTGCVGQCASSPVITIDRIAHKNLHPDMLQAILDQYQ